MIYVYWEISANIIEEFPNKHGESFDIYSLVLRIYDISYIDFNGFNANKYFDMKINPDVLS